jgi:hypothetical protein
MFVEQLQKALLRNRVQTSVGSSHDHKFRIVLEGLHDRDPLAHAPGVVPDLPRQLGLGKFEAVAQFPSPGRAAVGQSAEVVPTSGAHQLRPESELARNVSHFVQHPGQPVGQPCLRTGPG